MKIFKRMKEGYRLWRGKTTHKGVGIAVGSFVRRDGTRMVSLYAGKHKFVLSSDGAAILARQIQEWVAHNDSRGNAQYIVDGIHVDKLRGIKKYAVEVAFNLKKGVPAKAKRGNAKGKRVV